MTTALLFLAPGDKDMMAAPAVPGRAGPPSATCARRRQRRWAAAAGDPRVLRQGPQPKQLVVVDGSAHAQFLLSSDQGERVMTELVRFFSAP